LPRTGGVRPQLTVLVDLDSLQGRAALGGDTELGPLPPETCRRLACDGAVTRVLVTRHGPGPNTHPDDPGDHDHTQASGHHELGGQQAQDDPGGPWGHDDPHRQATLADRLRAAARLLPPVLGGPRPSPWTSAAPPGSSPPPNAPPWPSATAAVSSPAVTAPFPGARPTIWSTGWMAAPPIWTTWSCCAGPTIGPSMRAAGGSSTGPTDG
jgi:hypothetical protein